VQSVSEFNREISGAITLGTGATACIHLYRRSAAAAAGASAADGRVTTGNTLDIVRAVEENRLDLGLVTLPANGRNLAVIRWWMRSLCLFLPVDRMRCRWS
jgi:DNA-binding transcriptional LysR family regulator